MSKIATFRTKEQERNALWGGFLDGTGSLGSLGAAIADMEQDLKKYQLYDLALRLQEDVDILLEGYWNRFKEAAS